MILVLSTSKITLFVLQEKKKGKKWIQNSEISHLKSFQSSFVAITITIHAITVHIMPSMILLYAIAAKKPPNRNK